MKPIQVFVRHCYHSPCSNFPGRTRPGWFNLSLCWQNLLKTINWDKAQLHVVFDEHFGPMPDWLKNNNDVQYHTINAGTEGKSFLKLLEIVKAQNLTPNTIVYLLEGDYLHRAGWCNALLDGFDLGIRKQVDYITLYDHAHMYHEPHVRYRTAQLYLSSTAHWRTIIYTTNTFACTYERLLNDMHIHRLYSTNTSNGATDDCAKWEKLHEQGILFLSPIPGFSTHVDGFLSPHVNWPEVNNPNTLFLG